VYAWEPLLLTLFSYSPRNQPALLARRGQVGVDWSTLLTPTAITLLPVLVVFLLLQRYLLSNLAAGSKKGLAAWYSREYES